MTLLELLSERYWPEHALTLKRSSYDQLRYSIEAYGKHLGRPAVISDLVRVAVLTFLAARQSSVSAATVNKDRRSILCLWRHAAEEGLCSWPTRLMKAKEPQRIPHTFTHEQIEKLINAATHSERAAFWRSFLLALYDTAGRVKAMLSVKVGDVSFTDLTLRLAPENSKTKTEQVLPIATDTAQAIAAQVLGRNIDEPVWPWKYNHRRLFVHFRKLCEAASVPLPPGKCFHSLRRTSATLCAAELGIEAACRKLAHSSSAITQRYVDQSRLNPLRWLPPRPFE